MRFFAISCAVAASGIFMGSAGAHAFAQELASRGRTEVWNTAVLYHLVHGVALFSASSSGGRLGALVVAKSLWLAGVACFSGSLYALSLLEWSFLGPVTPLGGLLLLAGWLWAPFEARSFLRS